MPTGPPLSPEAVFDRHFREVYGYVAYRLAPDLEAARDVTQEVFLAAFRGWNSYRGDGSILSWLRGIARRKVADHLCLRRERQLDSHDLAGLAANGNVEAAALACELAQAMRMLPPEYVGLLEEKYLEGLSVRDIARRRSRTEKAVESALARARESFRAAFLQLKSREEKGDEQNQYRR